MSAEMAVWLRSISPVSGTVCARTADNWKPNEVCSNKHAIHDPSIYFCTGSRKLAIFAYCYTVRLRQLNRLGLMSGCVR